MASKEHPKDYGIGMRILNTVEPSDGVSISWLNVLKQTRTLSKIGNKPPQYLQ